MKHARLFGLAVLALCLALAALSFWLPARADSPREPSPSQVVQTAWRNAQDAGAYHFHSIVTQITHPGPALANVGRSSRRKTLHLEGETDLPAERLLLHLWDEAEGRGPEDALEMLVEGARAYGRCPTCDWEEVEDFRGLFLPGTDLMVYLAGAKNTVELGRETRAGMTYTRYAFDVDGPGFGEYLRAQMEAHLRARG